MQTILIQAVLMAALASLGTARSSPIEDPAAEIPPEPLPIEWVLKRSMEQYPGLKAARAHWQSMRARVAQERAWADPQVGSDIERAGSTRFDRYMAVEWMVSQQVPVSGKNRQRALGAAAVAAAAFAELHRQELEVTARVRIAFFRAANAQTQIELNLEQQKALEAFLERSREKPQPAARLQADLLTGQTERAVLAEHRFDFKRDLSEQQSQLNILMNRPPHAALPRTARLNYRPLAPSPLATPAPGHGPEDGRAQFDWAIFEQRIQGLALAHRPELVSARHHTEAAQARHTVSRREWIPDPEFRVAARQYDSPPRGLREYDTGVQFNVPWLNWRKYRAGIEETREDLARTRYDLETRELETMALLRDLVRRLEVVQQHYESFRDQVLPLAERALEAVELNYMADQASFWELLMAFRQYREAEMMQQQHLAEYWETIAELEAATGVRLSLTPGLTGLMPDPDSASGANAPP